MHPFSSAKNSVAAPDYFFFVTMVKGIFKNSGKIQDNFIILTTSIDLHSPANSNRSLNDRLEFLIFGLWITNRLEPRIDI